MLLNMATDKRNLNLRASPSYSSSGTSAVQVCFSTKNAKATFCDSCTMYIVWSFLFSYKLNKLKHSYQNPFRDLIRSGVSGNSRSRPLPGILASHSRSQSLGMSFSFPFPFPKVGNAIFHSRSQNSGMQFSIPVPVSGNGL